MLIFIFLRFSYKCRDPLKKLTNLGNPALPPLDVVVVSCDDNGKYTVDIRNYACLSKYSQTCVQRPPSGSLICGPLLTIWSLSFLEVCLWQGSQTQLLMRPHHDEKRARGPHKEEKMTPWVTRIAKSALIPHKTVILTII